MVVDLVLEVVASSESEGRPMDAYQTAVAAVPSADIVDAHLLNEIAKEFALDIDINLSDGWDYLQRDRIA